MDETQFKDYYDEYVHELVHFLGYYTKDAGLIEDVIQDIFVTLWSHKDDSSIRKVKPYLYSCARNTVVNELRLRKSTLELTDLAQLELQVDDESSLDNDYFFKLLYEAIEQLPPKMRSTFKAVKLDKMSYAAVASRDGISVRTVEHQVSEAMSKLRLSMHKYDKLFSIVLVLI